MEDYKEQNTSIQRSFIHPEKISEVLHCCICDEVFNNPMRLDCGHTFCYYCIEEWLKRSNKCPCCRISIITSLISRDLLAYNIIMNLEVCCNNASVGCPWKGKLSDLNNHMKVCNENISIVQNLNKSPLKNEKKTRRAMINMDNDSIDIQNLNKILNNSDSKTNNKITKENIDNLKKIFSE